MAFFFLLLLALLGLDLRLEIPPSHLIPNSSSAPCPASRWTIIVMNIILCNTFSPIISSPGCADVCNLFAEFRQGRHNGSGRTSESISFDKGKQMFPLTLSTHTHTIYFPDLQMDRPDCWNLVGRQEMAREQGC